MPNDKTKDNMKNIVGCSLFMVAAALSLFLCVSALAVFVQYLI